MVFLMLVGCDDEVKLVGGTYYACNYATYGGGGLALPFPDATYNKAPANEPCLSKYTQVVKHDWTAQSEYQTDGARFDINALQGLANSQETLDGSWLLIYDFAGQGSEDNGKWNRQVCNIRQKNNELHVYQADCPLLQYYGDLSYNPNTASISNDGIGQWPTDDYALGQEVAVNNVVVNNFAKINGVAQFTRFRNNGNPPAVTERPFQLVRLGEADKVLGEVQLRDVAALEVDGNTPYTTTWQITSFKESLQFEESYWLSNVEQFDKRKIKSVYYEFTVDNGQGKKRVLIAEASFGNRLNDRWVKADTEKRDYYCFNNGSDNGCTNIQKYPGISQYIDYDTLPEYAVYDERKMALSQSGMPVDQSHLLGQTKGYFDVLQDNAHGIQIHFRYEDATSNQEGLVSLSY